MRPLTGLQSSLMSYLARTGRGRTAKATLYQGAHNLTRALGEFLPTLPTLPNAVASVRHLSTSKPWVKLYGGLRALTCLKLDSSMTSSRIVGGITKLYYINAPLVDTSKPVGTPGPLHHARISVATSPGQRHKIAFKVKFRCLFISSMAL